MIYFYKLKNLKSYYDNKKISKKFLESIDFIDEKNMILKNTKVIVVHINNYKELEDFKSNIIVIDDKYNIENYLTCIKCNIKYYLPNSENILYNIQDIVNIISQKETKSLEIDNQLNKITINNKTINLTAKEIQVFEYLNNNKNKLCLRKSILVDVLKYHVSSDSRIVDVYIRYLRNKLEDEGKKIKTIRGKGYIYET